ncbi:MAG: N-acetylmuramoyl-L-alanine amidase [Leptolyngbyaceae bacterium]|nr:N-acetylmuramoyl-L-alanine amidase [Leptolyngbyaceae bacterium]
MRWPWLIPGVLGTILVSSAAEAATLRSWRFDANQNRLEFTTDEGVQPKAQLIANPTRLVIDLPGIKLGRSSANQTIGGTIRSVRVGQFDPDTARIVIELAPGYTLDPQRVQFRGNTPNRWSVQLPTPEYNPAASEVVVPAESSPSTTRNFIGNPPASATQIQKVRITPDGFFIVTSGSSPEVELERSPNRSQIHVLLKGTTIAPSLIQRDLLINRYGVRRIQINQVQASPPITRLTLNVANTSPDWKAMVSNLGGVVLIPSEGVAAAIAGDFQVGLRNDPPVITQFPNQIATVQSVNLEGNGTQFVIRADQPLRYTSGWERSSGSYRITLSPARLSPQVKGPQINATSSLLRVRLRQEDPRTVAILLQPAAGVQFGEISQLNNQLLSLQIQRRGTVVPTQPPITTIVPTTPPIFSNPPRVPTTPQGRWIVVLDAGHGGRDPGAVGIGGLQEKGIVLDITQQIAAVLQQRGVQVVLTRQDDREIDLEPRVALAERLDATVFVSIHANAISLSRPDINGLETYYYSSGEQLARAIHNSVLRGTGVRDRGVRKARFYVLRKTSMPSVLVETGFVTGAEDAARLVNPTYRRQMAEAIAQGVLQYLQQRR